MYKADDLDLLLPSFKPYVLAVEAAMIARGFQPVAFDTWRSPKEAAKYAARGVGSKDSMHIYKVACDHICALHGWDCKKSKCKFFQALGEEVERVGMVWGGRFKSKFDAPHMQGVSLADQDDVRAIADETERDAFIRARLCKPLLAA